MKSSKNPQSDLLTQKAVAVKKHSEDAAPKITAKGRGFNAEKILDIAFAEGVKVRQDSELTEMLEALDIESPIPLEALHTVSLILERVYESELLAREQNQANEKS